MIRSTAHRCALHNLDMSEWTDAVTRERTWRCRDGCEELVIEPAEPLVNAALATIGPLMTHDEAEQMRAEMDAEWLAYHHPEDVARLADLQSELTALTEQNDVYRDRCQQLAAELTGVRTTSAALTTALRALVHRLRRTGGYATPEEQSALWQAETLLAGVAEKGSGVPAACVEAPSATDGRGGAESEPGANGADV